MPRNGSGTYSLPSGNPVVTGSTISSTTHNNTMSDVATALSASLAKDGQTTPSANLPMGGYKHTNVADAAARTQYCSAGQAQDNALDWLSSVSGTDTITATAPLSMSAYAAGQHFRFVPAGANTGAATININAIGAKSITKNGTVALAAGDLPANAVCEVTYDGTQFQLVSIGALQVGSTVQAYAAAGTASEITTGTETAIRTWAPDVLNDAMRTLAAPQSVISYTGTGGITSKGATLATTGTIPSDNTIPQNTEGDPLLDVTITPSVSGVVIEVEVNIQGYASTVANGCVALFQDSTANAIGGRSFYHDAGNRPYAYSFKERITAPNTTPITFKVRGGGNTGTMNWNGNTSIATMGGIFNGYVKATEVVFP